MGFGNWNSKYTDEFIIFPWQVSYTFDSIKISNQNLINFRLNQNISVYRIYYFFQVAKAKRDFDVKKAQYDTEVNAANAEANLASTLQVKYTKSDFSKNYSIFHHLIDPDFFLQSNLSRIGQIFRFVRWFKKDPFTWINRLLQ